MQITIASRRKREHTLLKTYPGAAWIDLTSKGPEPWVRFSPFFPHGEIPVPFSPGITAASVEGVWQGLKVFNQWDIDQTKFHITTMRGLKRTVRRFGPVQGHRRGIEGKTLLDYATARQLIYIPTYTYVLETYLQNELRALRELAHKKPLVLLDYETNQDPANLNKPLSHAALVRDYLMNQATPAT